MREAAQQAMLDRLLPLKLKLRQGRHGATTPEGPGVRLSVIHPLAIATIIARRDRGAALSSALERNHGLALPEPGRMRFGKELTLQWCGPEQYYAVAEGRREGALAAELGDELRGLASISDQSHGRVVIAITGPRSRALLAKGSPVDFHPRRFGVMAVAATQMAHVGVHVSRWGEDAYQLSLFRGFSEHFFEWLTEQAEEFGYEVL